ncbi:MAG TPA: hypothetical protein PKD96_01260 [Candidatus Absconditabacterales bacterium]|nr:hypothetical protein [Candidatus Absconditabacterales bacterium]HMT26909.1 hypothetical protein [Candidatus Absconditabacterales bacterium]
MATNPLLFYQLMNYPIPREEEFFYYEKEKNLDQEPDKKFSREIQNIFRNDYLPQIKKIQNLLKYIPFIEQAYLCNSMSFNALTEKSDIDLFIITNQKRIWQCRFRSVFLFRIAGLKRSKKNKTKKVCLSFYVTSDNTNLYPIKLANSDIYLTYWLAHLIPIYTTKPDEINKIRESNKRLHHYLPNHPLHQTIFADIELIKNNYKITKRYEKNNSGRRGSMIEIIIKNIRLPVLFFKKKQLKQEGEGIIISNSMLKFHHDQRKKIAYLFKINNK